MKAHGTQEVNQEAHGPPRKQTQGTETRQNIGNTLKQGQEIWMLETKSRQIKMKIEVKRTFIFQTV